MFSRRRGLRGARWVLLGSVAFASACALPGKPASPAAPSVRPALGEDAWTAGDRTRLPVTRWRPAGRPHGVVLALHGFAEHRQMFYALAPHLAGAGYLVVAYDQRGFGETATRGHWAGRGQLVDDARTAWQLLRRRHPDIPVHLLGHSMGAAVAALAVTGQGAIEPETTILLAPGVHGWDTLPWVQAVALRLGAWIAPGAEPRQSWGRAIADVRITDDPRIRAIQAGDPLVLHAVRLDALHGVVDLMDAALTAAPGLPASTLIQYGERDDIIPRPAGCALARQLLAAPAPRARLALYPDGYHYLARDRQRRRTIGDMLAWLESPRDALPSGAGLPPSAAATRLCEPAGQPGLAPAPTRPR